MGIKFNAYRCIHILPKVLLPAVMQIPELLRNTNVLKLRGSENKITKTKLKIHHISLLKVLKKK